MMIMRNGLIKKRFKPDCNSNLFIMQEKIFINRDGLEIGYEKVICDIKSRYQRIRILETKKFGKIIILDDIMFQAEQGDELTEMATHLPFNVGSKKKRILMIGGGDGFALKEIAKHSYVEAIDMVEIDGDLLNVCKKIFLFNNVWNDKRLRIFIEDGEKYLESYNGKPYDVIISTPANTYKKDGAKNIAFSLFQDHFFSIAHKNLTDDGIFVTDGSTAHYVDNPPNWLSIYDHLKRKFKIVKPYFFASKRMPGGSFVLVYASKGLDPIVDFNNNLPDLKTNYYNMEIHKAAFALPEFLKRKIK